MTSLSQAYAAKAAMENINMWQKLYLESASEFHKAMAKTFPGTAIETFHNYANAVCESSARMFGEYGRPSFDIHDTTIDTKSVKLEEKIVSDKPFARLIHFEKQSKKKLNQPKVLLVSPLSGHFVTLLRNTIKDLLPDHDVYITDWKNARNISKEAGKFDQEDYIKYVKSFVEEMGPNTHLIGVCQGAMPALAATSLLAEEKSDYEPLSVTMTGAPIYAHANITEPVQLAQEKGFEFFEKLIARVPAQYDGAGRRVYPGFLQLMAFMNMNLEAHTQKHLEFFEHLTLGDEESAEKHREFYDEYMAVLDMTAEFYLQTILHNFIECRFAHGKLTIDGKPVDPSKIKNVGLMSVEGGKDDISAIGQTVYAHRLCTGIPDDMQRNVLNPNVGHYGTFNGRRFKNNIAPQIAGFIREMGTKRGVKYDPVPVSHIQPISPRTWKQAQKDEYNNLLNENGIAKTHFIDQKSEDDPTAPQKNKPLVPKAA